MDASGANEDLQLERDELAKRCAALQERLRAALGDKEAEYAAGTKTAKRESATGGVTYAQHCVQRDRRCRSATRCRCSCRRRATRSMTHRRNCSL
jgi:hypothetical protein